MSQYPECKHGHNDPNSECQQCNAEDRIVELSLICCELKDALLDANGYDEAASGYNSDNFSHMRQEFNDLAARAERMLSH
jgi:hypothetical protein